MDPTSPTAPPPPPEPVTDPPPAPMPAVVSGWNAVVPTAPTGARPTGVTVAAIFLIAFGALVSLFGLLFVVVGMFMGAVLNDPAFADQFPDLIGVSGAVVGGIVAAIGAIVLAFGLLELFSGIFILGARSWARITGIVVGVLGGLLSLSGLFPGEGTGGGSGIVVAAVLLAAYVFTVWMLAVNGRYFTR